MAEGRDCIGGGDVKRLRFEPSVRWRCVPKLFGKVVDGLLLGSSLRMVVLRMCLAAKILAKRVIGRRTGVVFVCGRIHFIMVGSGTTRGIRLSWTVIGTTDLHGRFSQVGVFQQLFGFHKRSCLGRCQTGSLAADACRLEHIIHSDLGDIRSGIGE